MPLAKKKPAPVKKESKKIKKEDSDDDVPLSKKAPVKKPAAKMKKEEASPAKKSEVPHDREDARARRLSTAEA